MLFNSYVFLIFFPIVALIYFVIPQKVRYLWLLFASYYFYACWNAKYVLLLLFSTTMTYFSGILINHFQNEKFPKSASMQKCIVALSLLANLGVLFFFKYANFASSLITFALSKFHITVQIPQTGFLLPVGISFYTFQSLSYTIDVYRGDTKAERNFFRYALYVSFFPQLVAGPIERSKNLLKQLAAPSRFNYDRARDGLLICIWGYFLKIVLADRIAIVVDTVYNNYEEYNGYFFIVASVLFALQIYCDFAGYSTIAIGVSKMLGIELMENFDAPYTALSVSEFWRRWHISLTSWFKDYLYLPLGGNRKGITRKHLNRMIVFLTSGLWHGAGIHFVIWGGINGLYQIIGELLMPLRKKVIALLRFNEDSLGFKAYKAFVTFCLVDISWIYFRASTFHVGNTILLSIFHSDNPWILFDGSLYQLGLNEKNFRLMLLCIGILAFADIMKRLGICVREIILKQDYLFRWIIIAFCISFVVIFGIWGGTFNESNFIYFQF